RSSRTSGRAIPPRSTGTFRSEPPYPRLFAALIPQPARCHLGAFALIPQPLLPVREKGSPKSGYTQLCFETRGRRVIKTTSVHCFPGSLSPASGERAGDRGLRP